MPKARPALRNAMPEPAPGQLELVRPPAPGQLELVRTFLNTLDVERGTDRIATIDGLTAWLRENGLIPKAGPLRLTNADVARVQRVRDSLRALTRRNNGIGCACDLEVLETASRTAAIALRFDPLTGLSQLQANASGVEGALGQLISAVHTAMADKTWARLKSCADEGCGWVYFDHSKNGCSRWCTTDVCGNRNKVKAYRERRAQSSVT